MGGGLLQLVIVGQQDSYLSENPSISYFKYAYKKHTNFSMDSIQLTFNTNPVFDPNINNASYLCKIGRYGDLLDKLYFCFTLPDIYSSDLHRFRWISNIGNNIIKKATISVGGTIIDTITNDWLNIWNELVNGDDDDNYNLMLGNVDELTEPSIVGEKRVSIVNNRFVYNYYPTSDINNLNAKPSINSRNIIVPLKFWFTKNPALALPLLRLQYSEIFLNIELENCEKLYTIYSKELEKYISSQYFNELYVQNNDFPNITKNININTFCRNNNIFPYIEANFIFLAQEERNKLFLIPKLTYLVEQLDITSTKSIPSDTEATTLININNHKPTKEILWITRRDDYYTKFNMFNNYTASINENKSEGILDKAAIIWNNTNTRVEFKNADFYNILQPYQHHSNIPKQGIYCYSFALHPEKFNPSGYYNASLVSTKLQVNIKNKYNNDLLNNKLNKYFHNKNYNFDYLVNVYSLSYNVFEIVGGSSGLKFA